MSSNSQIIADAAKPRLAALLIGIDTYLYGSVGNLTGPVADVQDVDTYLKKELKVPPSRIKKLCGPNATRNAIIKGFIELKEDTSIEHDDPILIFFAGHGSEMDAPKGWPAERAKIQLILPYDVTKDGDTILNAIADRTIGVLLEELAKAKDNNNITVIFDSCHSHSATREDSIARFAELKGNLPSDLDSDVLSVYQGRDPFEHPNFLHHGLRSHVLLAACSSKGKAYESGNRGNFTKALMKTLRNFGVSKVTYRDLVETFLPKLESPEQSPHCEGYHKNRLLFSIKTADSALIPVTEFGSMLMAGDAHGITPESEFDVYAERFISPGLPLGRFQVAEIKPTEATLDPVTAVTSTLPKLTFARLVSYVFPPGLGLKIYLSEDFKEFVENILTAAKAGLPTNQGSTKYERTDKDTATLLVERKGRIVTFHVRIPGTLVALDQRQSWSPNSAEDISRVLQSAGHWNWHFMRQGSGDFRKDIRVEFYRLKQGYDDQRRLVWKPDGPNVNREGVIDIANTGPRRRFGMKIVNKTNYDLYPYLVYFGVKSQAIVDYKLGSAGKGDIDQPLLAESSLTVGYGATGGAPFTFNFPDGAAKEDRPGFFKIFLTTSSTNFHSLMHSPFLSSRDPNRSDPKWDAVTVKVIERFA